MTAQEPLDPPTPRGSPLAFALGALTAQVTSLNEEQQRTRVTTEGMPDKIAAILSPRIISLEATRQLHDARITALERDRWKVLGGGVVVLVIVGVIIGKPLGSFRF